MPEGLLVILGIDGREAASVEDGIHGTYGQVDVVKNGAVEVPDHRVEGADLLVVIGTDVVLLRGLSAGGRGIVPSLDCVIRDA